MAGKTSNYNLTKPFEEEGVDVNVINQNMDTIDTNLKSLSDEINEVKEDIPSTDGLVSQTTLNVTLTDYAKKSELPDEYDDTVLSNKVTIIETNLGGHTVKSNVPENAKFTDTIYDDTALKTELTTTITNAKTEIVNTILGEAVNEDFDTLTEVANWILADTTNSAQLITRVTTLETEIGNKADHSTLPTKVSQLTNDKGYLTSSDIDTSQNHSHSNKTVLDKLTQSYLDKIDGISEGAEANVQSDWNAVSGDAFIKNKPEFANVATTGSYNDLVDKPTIPSSITVDSALSSTSTNPVQNKIINEALNNKASVSHGTHVTYSDTVPNANGTASVGTATTVSRSDHVHPLQTSVTGSSGSCTGNSATATKATQDASGNVITTSYASSASLSGNNLLIKSKSGATLSTVDLSGFSNSNVSSGTKMYYTTTEPTGKNGEIWIA